VVAIFCG